MGSFWPSGVECFAYDNDGVSVLRYYLLPRVSLSAEYDRIFELEVKLGRRPEFAVVARYTQCGHVAQVR
jgi:hypothetical protein